MADPRKAGERADQLIAEQNRLRTEAAAQMAARATAELEDQSVSQETQKPVATATPDVSAPAPDATQVNRDVEALKEQVRIADQRWNVLQGMINKKDIELDNMRLLLAQLSQKQSEPQQQQPQRQSVISKQDVEDFGQDLIDLIGKIAHDTAMAVVARESGDIKSKFNEMKKSVDNIGASSAKTAADVFDENLTKRVPNWQQVNVDPAFLSWLQGVDDFTGIKRIDLLTDAYNRMDLPRTAKFFTAFLGTQTDPAPVAAPAADVTKLVVPNKPRASTPTTTPQTQTRLWSRRDIAQLYEDKRNNRITQEEFDKQERDLFKAQSENRLAA